jgi:hypothetical protein
LEDNRIGYKELFATLQSTVTMSTGAGIISIVYNPNEEEYYIGTSAKSYLYNKKGLTEIDKALTSYVNLGGSLLSSHDNSIMTAKPLSAVTDILSTNILSFETEVTDFNIGGIKTINTVEVQGTFGTSALVECMVKWRNDRSSTLNSTTWKRCSPAGICSPIVSGVDLAFCVRVTPYTDVSINSILVEWQLSDKHGVRGQYVGSASSK